MFDDVLVEPGWRRVAGPGPCCPESEPLPCEHERALVARLHAEECRTQVDPPMGVFDGLTGTDDVDDSGTVPVPAAQTVLGEVTGSTGLPLAITLAQVPLHELDGADLVEAAAAWGRVAAWAHAHLAQAAAQLGEEMHHLAGPLVHPGWDGMPPGSTPERLAATELSMRMSTTRQAAESLVRTGRLLNGPLQGTGEALERGQIDARKADIIARALERAPLPVALAVEDAVLPTAGRRTHPQLAQDVARALIEVDPGEAQTRHRRARAKRRVNHPRALPDGMASISAVLPAQDAVALDLALDSVARSAKSGGDCRTLDQLRADALAGIGLDALRTGYLGRPSGCRCTVRPAAAAGGSHRPAASGSAGPAVRAGVGAPVSDPTCQRPTPGAESGATSTDPPALASGPRVLGAVGGEPVRVHVTVPLSTLLGGGEPGDLAGYGPIDAATARALALGGTWRRIVTDPLSGTVLDVGRRRYRPPPDLARLVRARDRTCVRPGCGVRATSCDLDHTVPFGAGPDGGATALHNLGAQCRTDHVLKTNGDFRVRQLPGGVFEWTSRTGHTYRRESNGTITHLGRTQPPRPRTAPGAARLTDPMAEPDDADLPPLRAWHNAGPTPAPEAPDTPGSSDTTTPHRPTTPWGQGDCPF